MYPYSDTGIEESGVDRIFPVGGGGGHWGALGFGRGALEF